MAIHSTGRNPASGYIALPRRNGKGEGIWEGGGCGGRALWHSVKTFLKHLQIFQHSFRLYIENWQILEASANNLWERFFYYYISKQLHLEFIQSGFFGASDLLALGRKYFVLLYSLQQTLWVTLEGRKKRTYTLHLEDPGNRVKNKKDSYTSQRPWV